MQIQTSNLSCLHAANVNTSNLCATQHPTSFVTVNRRTRLLQYHSDRTRYIIGMIILIVFFSVQALRHPRCVSSSHSTVHYCVWRLIQEHLSRLSVRTLTAPREWRRKGRNFNPLVLASLLHLIRRIDSSIGHNYSYFPLKLYFKETTSAINWHELPSAL